MDDPLLKEIVWKEYDSASLRAHVVHARIGRYNHRELISDRAWQAKSCRVSILAQAKKECAGTLIAWIHRDRERDKREADAQFVGAA